MALLKFTTSIRLLHFKWWNLYNMILEQLSVYTVYIQSTYRIYVDEKLTHEVMNVIHFVPGHHTRWFFFCCFCFSSVAFRYFGSVKKTLPTQMLFTLLNNFFGKEINR